MNRNVVLGQLMRRGEQFKREKKRFQVEQGANIRK